jgi:hypothetical protein
MKWAVFMVSVEKRRGVYRSLAGKSTGRRSLERQRRGSDNIIKMVLKEIGWEVIDWCRQGSGEKSE